MRLVTKTFVSSFLPMAALLLGSFWALRSRVETEAREDLRTAARQNQAAIQREQAHQQLLAQRILHVLAQDSSFADLPRPALEQRLTNLATEFQLDLLAFCNPAGAVLGAVRRTSYGMETVPLDFPFPQEGFVSIQTQVYEISSRPAPGGHLALGEHLDLSRFVTPTILLRDGRIVASSASLSSYAALESALSRCGPFKECEFDSSGSRFLSLPLRPAAFGYALRSVESFNVASAPLNAALTPVFLSALLAVLGAALAISALNSRTVARPIAVLVRQLKESEATGTLPDFIVAGTGIQEIRELAEGFNRAATSIRDSRDDLVRAYVAFTGSLAQALDARDPYTAGHSRRVSDYACAIARVLGVSGKALDDLRIGALLHDIGKIGIDDQILRKAERLTPEEEALIREHPAIGRRILEGVDGFAAYLDVVELHHENWDGSGYPHGLVGTQTPLAARIVKVADAYDAMTSDRPYRPGMTHEAAIARLIRSIGSEFESRIVFAFKSLGPLRRPVHTPALYRLRRAVAPEHRPLLAAERPTSQS